MKKNRAIMIFFAIIGAVAFVAVIAYAVVKFVDKQKRCDDDWELDDGDLCYDEDDYGYTDDNDFVVPDAR